MKYKVGDQIIGKNGLGEYVFNPDRIGIVTFAENGIYIYSYRGKIIRSNEIALEDISKQINENGNNILKEML